MGQVIGIKSDHIRAVEGAEIPTLKVSGTVGVDFSGSQLADAVTEVSASYGEARLMLDSFGGFASDAFSFYDTIRGEGIRLHVDGRGTIASAATIIMAAAGRKRSRLFPNAEYLVHNASGGDEEGVARANIKMQDIYMELTGMTRPEIKRLMGQDKAMSAQDAKRLGFVGAIVELQKLAANADKKSTMAEEVTKVKRVFAVDRKDAAAAAFTGEIEIAVDIDKELNDQLASAVDDLKAERTKSADLKASVDAIPDTVAKAVKDAEDKLKAEHAAALEAGGKENQKLRDEIEALKKTPAAPAVKAKASGDTVDVAEPGALAERYPKLNKEQRAASIEKVRHKQTA